MLRRWIWYQIYGRAVKSEFHVSCLRKSFVWGYKKDSFIPTADVWSVVLASDVLMHFYSRTDICSLELTCSCILSPFLIRRMLLISITYFFLDCYLCSQSINDVFCLSIPRNDRPSSLSFCRTRTRSCSSWSGSWRTS